MSGGRSAPAPTPDGGTERTALPPRTGYVGARQAAGLAPGGSGSLTIAGQRRNSTGLRCTRATPKPGHARPEQQHRTMGERTPRQCSGPGATSISRRSRVPSLPTSPTRRGRAGPRDGAVDDGLRGHRPSRQPARRARGGSHGHHQRAPPRCRGRPGAGLPASDQADGTPRSARRGPHREVHIRLLGRQHLVEQVPQLSQLLFAERGESLGWD